MEENEDAEAVEEVVDIVGVAEAERAVIFDGINRALVGGDAGTKHTATGVSSILSVGEQDRPQLAPISEIGTELLASSSQIKFCLKDCDMGGTTIIFTEMSSGCDNLLSIIINFVSSFFSKFREMMSVVCVKIGCRCELIDVMEALQLYKTNNI